MFIDEKYIFTEHCITFDICSSCLICKIKYIYILIELNILESPTLKGFKITYLSIHSCFYYSLKVELNAHRDSLINT